MDELPELLVEAVGDATVIATVDLGGGDAVAVTPAATHLYRSEGLLSDETVETFDHDVDRLAVETGRRKSSLRFDSLEGEASFTVPSSVVDEVVEATLEGVLRATGVLAAGEVVEAQFRFSDLTLVVTDRQLVKHVGEAVWDEDFEAFRYEDLTDLAFEEGSVATQVVVESDGRQQRVKVPNDAAGRVRQEVQSSVFEYHGVSSLGGLRAAVGLPEPDAEAEADEENAADEAPASEDADTTDDGFVSADWSPPADQDITRSAGDRTDSGGDADAEADATGTAIPRSEGGSPSPAGSAAPGNAPDVDALAKRVDALAERLEYQTELLEEQQATIEQLVAELRRGR